MYQWQTAKLQMIHVFVQQFQQLKHLVEPGAKVILASHLGRPKGEVNEDMRLTAVGERLSELMNQPVKKLDESIGEAVEKAVAEMQDGDIVLLENVRFHKGEEKNDEELAKAFAKLADVYVNDAFGAAHRAHASTEGIAKFVTSCIRFLNGKRIRCTRKSTYQTQSVHSQRLSVVQK